MVKGCQGPNNCYDQNFKAVLTVVLISCSLVLHIVYKSGTLGDDKATSLVVDLKLRLGVLGLE